MSKLKEKTKLIRIQKKIDELIYDHCHGEFRSHHRKFHECVGGCSPKTCKLAGRCGYKSFHCRLVIASDAIYDILHSGAFDDI